MYPQAGLKDAREHRDAAHTLPRDSVDSSENRKATESTFQVMIALEWLEKFEKTKSERYWKGILSRFERMDFQSDVYRRSLQGLQG